MIGRAGMICRINYPTYHAGSADHSYPVPFFVQYIWRDILFSLLLSAQSWYPLQSNLGGV